ncbi:MAG: helix-turn-helix domain-containing protein [Oligosphaeraceae bacterium]
MEVPWDLRQFLDETYAFLPEDRKISRREGRLFRRRRQSLRLSLQETAELLHLHPSTLGKWERGECGFCQVPHAPSLQALRLWKKQGDLRRWLSLLQMRKRLRTLQDPALKTLFLQMRKLCLLPGGYDGLLPHLRALIRSLEQGILAWVLEEDASLEEWLPRPYARERPGGSKSMQSP